MAVAAESGRRLVATARLVMDGTKKKKKKAVADLQLENRISK